MPQQPRDDRRDRLAAMIRDPSSIFVYWELANDGRDALADRLDPGAVTEVRWTLRLTHLDNGATSDIPVDIEARNWYLSVLPGGAYEIELGVLDAGGRFHRLLAQGPLRLPPPSYSHLYDRQWMILEDDYLRLLELGGDFFPGSSGNDAPPEPEAPWITVEPEAPTEESAPTSPGVPDYKGRR